MNTPEFDHGRSDAIRAVLIDTVEQTPQRDHRRRVRIVVLAILAALGLGLGSSAVAVAVGGIDLFPPTSTEAVPAPTPAADATPSPSPSVAPTPTAAPHPLVVTDELIEPHDVLSAPAETPRWSIDVPGASDVCRGLRVIDVAEGYALLQTGPTAAPEDLPANCQPTETRLALSLVDTRDGVVLWTRDWSWPIDESTMPWTQTSLLGTSGKVLVQTMLQNLRNGQPYPFEVPNEVLDLATGQTIGVIDAPETTHAEWMSPVADASGDVIATTRTYAEPGTLTEPGTLADVRIARLDPLDPTSPKWSVSLGPVWAGVSQNATDSSVLQITHQSAGDANLEKVVDIDSGAIMVEGPEDRSYTYLDGVTLRQMGNEFEPWGATESVAGIDDAGNEFWSRSDPGGILVKAIAVTAADPRSRFPWSSDVLLSYPDGRLELVDGLTGTTRWVTDGSSCAVQQAAFSRAVDGVLLSSTWDTVFCGIAEDGTLVDVSTRPVPMRTSLAPRGSAATYDLYRGWGTGGIATYKFVPRDPDEPAQATVRDAVTGEVLWQRPIADDELWFFAGGYLIGTSRDSVYSVG